MNCNAVVCVTAGNKLIVVDEIVKQQDTDAMAREIRRRYGNNKIFVYPDASGAARSTINASKTDIAILESYGFVSMALRSNPPIKDRVQTLQAVLENSKGQIRMAIYAKATRLIECLEFKAMMKKQATQTNKMAMTTLMMSLVTCVIGSLI